MDRNAELANRIKRLREERGLSQSELGQLVGTTKQTIYKYEKGIVANLKQTKIGKLAKALGVSPSYLLFGDEYPETNGLAMLGKSVADKPTYIPTRRVPVLGPTAAGEPIIAEREYDEYVEVPADGKRYDAAVRVEGDSMLPLFHIGDLALVRYQPDVEDGEIAVVCIDDTVTLKRVYHVQGGIMLHSENPKYKPLLISEGDCNSIHLTGKVIGQLHWFED